MCFQISQSMNVNSRLFITQEIYWTGSEYIKIRFPLPSLPMQDTARIKKIFKNKNIKVCLLYSRLYMMYYKAIIHCSLEVTRLAGSAVLTAPYCTILHIAVSLLQVYYDTNTTKIYFIINIKLLKIIFIICINIKKLNSSSDRIYREWEWSLSRKSITLIVLNLEYVTFLTTLVS